MGTLVVGVEASAGGGVAGESSGEDVVVTVGAVAAGGVIADEAAGGMVTGFPPGAVGAALLAGN